MRRCFQALLSTVGLQLPVFPCVPFVACDLACLAWTVPGTVPGSTWALIYVGWNLETEMSSGVLRIQIAGQAARARQAT